MTREEMQKLAQETVERWTLTGLVTGWLVGVKLSEDILAALERAVEEERCARHVCPACRNDTFDNRRHTHCYNCRQRAEEVRARSSERG